MANGRQPKAKRMTMSERAQHQLALHFPDAPAVWLWHRKTNDGYISIPRTLPIAMQAIDAQTKGQPAGHTLFCLWSRSPDHALITIENPVTFASEAGFVGERAVDTWRRRMKSLRDLRFIHTKKGPSGDFHYVMLSNPNVATEWMRDAKLIQDGLYARFIDRVIEIGAYGEIEAIREYWEEAKKAEAEAERLKASQAASAPATAAPPPPPPPNTSPTVKRVRRTKAAN